MKPPMAHRVRQVLNMLGQPVDMGPNVEIVPDVKESTAIAWKEQERTTRPPDRDAVIQGFHAHLGNTGSWYVFGKLRGGQTVGIFGDAGDWFRPNMEKAEQRITSAVDILIGWGVGPY